MASVPGIPILEDKYIATMDMWPIEAKEFNRNYRLFIANTKELLPVLLCLEIGPVCHI